MESLTAVSLERLESHLDNPIGQVCRHEGNDDDASVYTAFSQSMFNIYCRSRLTKRQRDARAVQFDHTAGLDHRQFKCCTVTCLINPAGRNARD